MGVTRLRSALVIDDCEPVRRIARRILERLGFRAEAVPSGVDGLKACARAMPDLVLLDWRMPGLAGRDVLPALRGMAGGANAVVLLMTGERNTDVVRQAFALGANEALFKPFDKELVSEKLAQAGLL